MLITAEMFIQYQKKALYINQAKWRLPKFKLYGNEHQNTLSMEIQLLKIGYVMYRRNLNKSITSKLLS